MEYRILTIIVTYNGSVWIEKCLKSLFSDKNINLNVLCVDNNSMDNTVQIIKYFFPQVKVISNQLNLGFGKANNIGLNYAIENNYNYVFLLNQDTFVLNNSLQQLLNKLDFFENPGIISPIHLNWDGDELEANFEYFLNQINKSKLLSKLMVSKNDSEFFKIDFVNAAAWFIPIDVIKVVGGFNPIFPHYCEDIDYFNRIKYWGFNNYLVLDSFIHHYSSDSISKTFDFKKLAFREFLERLVVLCDINKSYKYGLRKVFLKSLNNFILFSYPFNLLKIKIEVYIFFKILKSSLKIHKVRNYSKRKVSYL